MVFIIFFFAFSCSRRVGARCQPLDELVIAVRLTKILLSKGFPTHGTSLFLNSTQSRFSYPIVLLLIPPPLFYRHLLMCRVTLGKSFLQFNAIKMAHAPPGHHSVMGRPSSGGLYFPEYVVYRGEQVSITHRFLYFYIQISI